MESRAKNVARTFAFGIINRVLAIIFPFIIRTIIIYKLGNEYAGLTSLFTSVLTILNVSELGINSAISFCMYKSVAENDVTTVNALTALMRKLYKGIGCFILVAGVSLMPFLDKFITGDYPASINIYWLYLIYLVNAVVSYLGFAYKQTIFEVHQRGDINHKIMAVVEIFRYVLQILVLLVFANYYYYAIIMPLASFAITLATQWKSRKMYPHIVPEGTVSKETKNTIKSKVVFLAAHSIAASLTNSVDNIVLSSTLGLVLLGMWGNYTYITSAINNVLLIGYKAVLPSFGNSMYTESKEKLYQLYHTIQLAMNWIVTWCSVCLFCLFQPFVTIWVGEANLLSSATVIMLVLYFYINAMRMSISTIYIQAAGLWNKTLFRQIVTALSNLVLDIVLVGKYGVTGVIFASFITSLLLSLPLDIMITYQNVLQRKAIAGIAKFISEFIAFLVIAVATYAVCQCVDDAGYAAFVCKACICVVVPNVLMWALVCRSEAYKELKAKAIGLLKSRKARG